MKSFFQFIKKPDIRIYRASTVKDKIRTLVEGLQSSFLLIFIAAMIISIFSFAYKYSTGIDLHENIILRENNYLKREYSPIIYYAIIIVGVPIFEECTYRLYLNPTRLTLSIFPSLIFLHLLAKIWYFKTYTQPKTYSFIFIAAVIFILVYNFMNKQVILYLSGKYFKYMFYFSAILFGFIHLMNFVPLNVTKIILSPIIVLPQIIYGFVLGYIRIKNGLVWSILLHTIINSIASTIELLK